jgi:hypothetical protein
MLAARSGVISDVPAGALQRLAGPAGVRVAARRQLGAAQGALRRQIRRGRRVSDGSAVRAAEQHQSTCAHSIVIPTQQLSALSRRCRADPGGLTRRLRSWCACRMPVSPRSITQSAAATGRSANESSALSLQTVRSDLCLCLLTMMQGHSGLEPCHLRFPIEASGRSSSVGVPHCAGIRQCCGVGMQQRIPRRLVRSILAAEEVKESFRM